MLIIWPSPDLSDELYIVRTISELTKKLRLSQHLTKTTRQELRNIFNQFSLLTRHISSYSNRSIEKLLPQLSIEGLALYQQLNWTYDIYIPSVYDFLPHTNNHPYSYMPIYKQSQDRSGVSITIGVPTVHRAKNNYLMTTLKSLIENMSPSEMIDCLIVVFIAEIDRQMVMSIASDINRSFKRHIDSGLIDIISPAPSYYPNMETLCRTLKDNLKRVQWRSKQNLDYAYLMMYAKSRSLYFVQLEDDVLTKPGYFSSMKNFVLETSISTEHNCVPWFLINFCQLGFIGKLFKTADLYKLVNLFLMFYQDQPVDWLLQRYIETHLCHPGKDCTEFKEQVIINFGESLFQHTGTQSSLEGKLQNDKDSRFAKEVLFVPHANPATSKIETNIKPYKHYTLEGAYKGSNFFWGLVPQDGDTLTFTLAVPRVLKEYRFVSGNAKHPNDVFISTSVEILQALAPNSSEKRTFKTIGSFDEFGIAEGSLVQFGEIAVVRICVHANLTKWVVLSEIFLKQLA